MKHSCGALLFTRDKNNQLGVILGLEDDEWLPFKGCNESNETYEETAIREILEETCGLIQITNISLEHRLTSKRKHYKIGLVLVDYDICDKFPKARNIENLQEAYYEKKKIKFFPLDDVLYSEVHNLSKASIRYYWNMMQSNILPIDNCRCRKLSFDKRFLFKIKHSLTKQMIF